MLFIPHSYIIYLIRGEVTFLAIYEIADATNIKDCSCLDRDFIALLQWICFGNEEQIFPLPY